MNKKELLKQLELLLNPDTLCPRIYNFTDVRDLLKAYKERLEKEPRTGDISAWINSVKASVYYPYFAQQEREKILREVEMELRRNFNPRLGHARDEAVELIQNMGHRKT